MSIVLFEDVKDQTTEEYFNGNQFSIDAFNKKYALEKDGVKETYVQAVKRVCDYIASCEETPALRKYWSERWFDEIYNDWWHPAGSIMQGAASGRNISMGNCNTISLGGTQPLEEWDSLEGLVKNVAYTVAKTAAYRQGIGVHFGRIRPKKMSVKNSANESTGSIHWMKFIDNIGNYVGQSGRVPAMLISQGIEHPDVIEFITCKSDKHSIQNANISVQITDDFYEAVEKNEDWTMFFEVPSVKKGQKVYIDGASTDSDCKFDDKVNKWYYTAKRSRVGERVERKESARKILELIAKNMCEHAEPGIQNIDLAHKYSNSDYVDDPTSGYCSKIVSSNACCVTGDTMLNTSIGYVRMDAVYKLVKSGETVFVDSYNESTNKIERRLVTNAWQTRNDSTVTVRIIGTAYNSNGYDVVQINVESSADHKFLTQRGYVEADKIKGSFEDLVACRDGDSIVYYRVAAVTASAEIKPLYDIEVQYNHNFVANGVVVHNSEQYLSPDSLCVLASLNMGRFSTVKEEYNKQLSIYAPSVNRFLDNVNTMEIIGGTYATPNQRKAIELLRRTGGGYTDMAGWLFKAGFEYGSKDGNEAVEEFTRTYNYYLYKNSIELGKEKGNFGLFNREKFERSPFIKRMMSLGLEFTHMRNVTCSSIAPAGTLSTQFRGCVMGYSMEPAFGIYYWKRTRISGKYEYYFCVPTAVKETLAKHGVDLGMPSDTIKDTWDGKHGIKYAKMIDDAVSKLGLKFKKASNVGHLDKLELMTGIMKWIDSSISVTYALPEGTKWQDIYDFILLARKKELKSISAFPDRRMYGIVTEIPFMDLAVNLTKDGIPIHEMNFSKEEADIIRSLTNKVVESEGAIQKVDAPKRPKVLNCDVHHIKVTKKLDKPRTFDYLVIVGLYKGEPYECFCMENGHVDKKYIFGTNTRESKGKYTVRFDDGFEIKDITQNTTDTEDAFTRMISANLRHGTPINFVVDQLDQSQGDMWSLSKAIARALKKYVKDGTEVKGECPKCGGKLVRYEGCKSCACGWTACS